MRSLERRSSCLDKVTRGVLVTFNPHKSIDMKTWLLALGLLGMVFTSFAQNSGLSAKGTQKNEVIRSNIRQGEFYGKLVVRKQGNTELVRFNIDDIVLRMTRDSEFKKNVQSIKTHRFGNVLEALNVLSSHGWEVRSTMVLRGRQGDEQHYVMAYSTDRLMPVSPWLVRENREGSRGQ